MNQTRKIIVILFTSKIYGTLDSDLKNKNINYFDLEAKKLYGSLRDHTTDVREFLQRSGITFDYID